MADTAYCSGCAERDNITQQRNERLDQAKKVSNEWKAIAQAGNNFVRAIHNAINDTEWGDDFEAEVKAALDAYYEERHATRS